MKKSILISILIMTFTLITGQTAVAGFGSDFGSFFKYGKHHKHNKHKRFCKILSRKIRKLEREEEKIHAKLEYLQAKYDRKCAEPPPAECDLSLRFDINDPNQTTILYSSETVNSNPFGTFGPFADGACFNIGEDGVDAATEVFPQYEDAEGTVCTFQDIAAASVDFCAD